MRLPHLRALLLLTVLSSAAICAEVVESKNSNARITGVYSNMRFNPQSGDVSGVEMFVVNTHSGYQVIFQDGEGVPNIPLVVAVQIKGTNFEFVLPERNGYTGKFVGQFNDNGLEGKFLNGAISADGPTFRLRKSCSYWQSSSSRIVCK